MKKLIIIGFILIQAACFAQNLDSGLVGYYSFNGNAKDMSGNGNDGIVHGATLTVDRFGNPNSAYYFYGKSKISTNSFTWQTNQFSIVGWIKDDDINPSQTDGWIPFLCRGEQIDLIDNSFGLQFSKRRLCISLSSIYTKITPSSLSKFLARNKRGYIIESQLE